MQEKKYTPGPWTFDGEDVEALDLDHPESICTIADPHPINGDRRVTNGLLVAAAPDLLVALQAWRTLLENGELQGFQTLAYADGDVKQAFLIHTANWDSLPWEQTDSAIEKATDG